jgi:hypothetical protein
MHPRDVAEIGWLEDQQKRVTNQLVTLDVEQEAQLNREIDRCNSETRLQARSQADIDSVMGLYQTANQLELERIGLENDRVRLGHPELPGHVMGSDADFLDQEADCASRGREAFLEAEKASRAMVVQDRAQLLRMEKAAIFVETEPEGMDENAERDAPTELKVYWAKKPKRPKGLHSKKWTRLFDEKPWEAKYNLEHKDEAVATGTLAIREALEHHVKLAEERWVQKKEEDERLAKEEAARVAAEHAESRRLKVLGKAETCAIEVEHVDKSVPKYFRKKTSSLDKAKRFLFKNYYDREEERVRVLRCVRDRMKVQVGYLAGMCNLKLIVHQEENDAFRAEQEDREKHLRPFRKQCRFNIGFHFPVYIWYEESIDEKKQITDVQLTHADPESRHFKNWGRKGYERVGHELLLGEKKDHHTGSLLLWTRHSSHQKPIVGLGVSYSLADEDFFKKDG